jgi:ribosomal protein L34E
MRCPHCNTILAGITRKHITQTDKLSVDEFKRLYPKFANCVDVITSIMYKQDEKAWYKAKNGAVRFR